MLHCLNKVVAYHALVNGCTVVVVFGFYARFGFGSAVVVVEMVLILVVEALVFDVVVAGVIVELD